MADQRPELLSLRGVETAGGAQVRPSPDLNLDLITLYVYSRLFVCLSVYEDESGPKHWTNLRYEHVMKLRQAALETAREMWADYILVHHLKSSQSNHRSDLK